MPVKPSVVWHYSKGFHLQVIAAHGLLMPADLYVKPPERPILWFSANEYWEPTASPGRFSPGRELGQPYSREQPLSVREVAELCDGLVRFGCRTTRLLTGEALRRKARMDRKLWDSLAAAGREQGADPTDWWGTTRPIAIGDLTVEVMSSAWVWEPVRP